MPVVSTAVGGVPEVVTRRRERPARAARRPGRARRRDPAHPRRAGLRDRLAAAAKPSVAATLERRDLRPARGAARGGGAMSDAARASSSSGVTRYQLPLPGVAREEVGRGRAASSTTASSARRPATARRATTASGWRAPRGRASSTASSSTSGCRSACGAQIRELPARTRSSRPIPFSARRRSLGRALAGRRPPVIVEVHGDWRTFARAVRLARAPADRARSRTRSRPHAVRRADATRAVSSFTAGLVEEVRGVPPSAVFTAFSDLSAFTERPPCAAARAADRRVRRRARAVQERRRARRRLAGRRRSAAGGAAGDRRQRLAAARGRAAR